MALSVTAYRITRCAAVDSGSNEASDLFYHEKMRHCFLMVSFREKQAFPQYTRPMDSIKIASLVKVGRI
jgi:hypothetical protein